MACPAAVLRPTTERKAIRIPSYMCETPRFLLVLAIQVQCVVSTVLAEHAWTTSPGQRTPELSSMLVDELYQPRVTYR